MTVTTHGDHETWSVKAPETYDIDPNVGGLIWEAEGLPNDPLFPTLFVLETNESLLPEEDKRFRVLFGEMDYLSDFLVSLSHFEYPTVMNPVQKGFIDPDDYLYDDIRFLPNDNVWEAPRWTWMK